MHGAVWAGGKSRIPASSSVYLWHLLLNQPDAEGLTEQPERAGQPQAWPLRATLGFSSSDLRWQGYGYFRTQHVTYSKIQGYPKIGMRLFFCVMCLAMVTKTWLGFWNIFFLEQYNDLNLKSLVRCSFPMINKNRKWILTTTSLPPPHCSEIISLLPASDWTGVTFPITQSWKFPYFDSCLSKACSYRLEIVTHSSILSPRGRQLK